MREPLEAKIYPVLGDPNQPPLYREFVLRLVLAYALPVKEELLAKWEIKGDQDWAKLVALVREVALFQADPKNQTNNS